MEKSIILSADLLDILFEGRNKSYGAYDLRKTYDKRITRSLAGTFLLCMLFIVGSILAHGKKKNSYNEVVATVNLENIKNDEPKPEIPKPIPKQEVKVKMSTFTPPRIVDEEIKPEEEIKEVDQLQNTRIGPINQDGIIDNDVIAAPVEKSGVTLTPPKGGDDIDKIFITVQKQAEFPGGIAGWRTYLERHLNKDLPSDNGAPAGDYTVVVSFIVDKSGVISDVKAENDPGYGTVAEAIKVIRKGPNWMPAEQNGNKVIYRQKQLITFRVSVD
jgi:protein TonB